MLMSNSKIPDLHTTNGPCDGEPVREMHPEATFARLQAQTPRHFLRSLTAGVGTMFLGTLASQYDSSARAAELNLDGTRRLDFTRDPSRPLAALPPQFAARATRILYLNMAVTPRQIELLESKPDM